MLCHRIKVSGLRSTSILSRIYGTHTASCPANQSKKGAGGGGAKLPDLKRAEKSGKCRYGFIPEEWFTFFHSKTGVSGPYVFGITVGNYILSKEILVMEHEYYGGLSVMVIMYLIVTKLGPGIGASLDKQVDEVVEGLEKGRKDEIKFHEETIKSCQLAQWMAEGQTLLIEAKKENVIMQLEAAYRERCMMIYRTVKGRMDYHVKRYYAEARIHQKWMTDWILSNVMKSITPDFEKRALDQAIQALGEVASRAK